MIYTVATGLARGAKGSPAAAMGCTLGIVPHLTAAIVRLAAFLNKSAVLFHVLKWVGTQYLQFHASRILRDDALYSLIERTSEHVSQSCDNWVSDQHSESETISILPSIFSQFVPAGVSTPVRHMLVLSVVFMVMNFVVVICYDGFASVVRARIERTPTSLMWLKRGYAATFVGLGMRHAFETR